MKDTDDKDIMALLDDNFEDNVMQDVHEIVLKRKVRRDRVISLIFIFLTCIAAASFLIVFHKIGMDIFPDMTKNLFLLLQDALLFVIILLLYKLKRSGGLIKDYGYL